MDRRAEIWTAEQLQRAAISELLRHGGSKADVDLLRRQFTAMNENSQLQAAQMEIPNDGAAS